MNRLIADTNQSNSQLTVLRALTDARGCTTCRLPWSGVWMFSVVYMVPATGEPGVDWDSHWGKLTFELPAKAPARLTQKSRCQRAALIRSHLLSGLEHRAARRRGAL